MRHVVRFSSSTPRRAPICASRLLMAGVVTSSSLAVAEKLPWRASRLKNAISEGAEINCDIIESK